VELDEPAGRWDPPRHRRPRRLQQAAVGPGIGPDTTIILYGDNNNWFAAWAYWQLKLYGHEDVRS
jgi:3-mercaptopyruvate sulfurtransferase SseA